MIPLTAGVAMMASLLAHVVLDPEIAAGLLSGIARQLEASQNAPAEDTRMEALFVCGERVHQFVELMNADVQAHGESMQGQLLAKRLSDLGIGVAFVQRSRRYVYDLEPYEQYLRRAPLGPRAADVKFRLISERFRRTLGTRPAEVAEGGFGSLAEAVRQEEAFIADYPAHPGVREVRFYLAIDYYRLHKNSPDRRSAKKYRSLARTALASIVRDYPGTIEARSAEPPLEELR